MAEDGEPIAEQIRDRLHEFTTSERKAAHILMADYPLAGLETVSAFAGRAGVSAPSILRFVARLGFANYPEFQRHLRDEIGARLKSPLMKSPAGAALHEPGRLKSFGRAIADNVMATFEHLPPAEFDAVVALLSDRKRRLHLIGGRFTDALARYMAAHLRILRPDVAHIAGQVDNWRDQLIDMDKRDVLVVFDIRRYQDDVVAFTEAAALRHVTVVLVTDQWLSPVARWARHVLSARIEAPSNWDSSAALMAIAEALVASVTQGAWGISKQRIEEIEKLRRPG